MIWLIKTSITFDFDIKSGLNFSKRFYESSFIMGWFVRSDKVMKAFKLDLKYVVFVSFILCIYSVLDFQF